MKTHLAPGESLVLYSDGVTESIADDQELGVAGLREIITRVGTSPDAILEQIGKTSDDVTLVAVRRRSAGF
jgi:serine phosphatase RsbU (regulator of sigma subunit)